MQRQRNDVDEYEEAPRDQTLRSAFDRFDPLLVGGAAPPGVATVNA